MIKKINVQKRQCMFCWPVVITKEKLLRKYNTNHPLYSVPAIAKIQERGNERVSQRVTNGISQT